MSFFKNLFSKAAPPPSEFSKEKLRLCKDVFSYLQETVKKIEENPLTLYKAVPGEPDLNRLSIIHGLQRHFLNLKNVRTENQKFISNIPKKDRSPFIYDHQKHREECVSFVEKTVIPWLKDWTDGIDPNWQKYEISYTSRLFMDNFNFNSKMTASEQALFRTNQNTISKAMSMIYWLLYLTPQDELDIEKLKVLRGHFAIHKNLKFLEENIGYYSLEQQKKNTSTIRDILKNDGNNG
ncbi:MAG: hypothetical protein KDJ35_00395 [Alphaproteobacteria bacterium]|nr:hypothetical protein [Alphaproteobacteria bacterium]